MQRGKLVILVIVAVAFLMAGLAWWNRYQQGRRAMQLWGAERALLIRHASRVELLSLDKEKSSGEESETLQVDGRELSVLKREDISHTRGLVHARHCLIEDASFDWDRSADDCKGDWSHALQFSNDQKTVTLALDLACGRALLIENEKADVRLVDRVKKALAKYLADHFQPTL